MANQPKWQRILNLEAAAKGQPAPYPRSSEDDRTEALERLVANTDEIRRVQLAQAAAPVIALVVVLVLLKLYFA
jgi:hypothetical protein